MAGSGSKDLDLLNPSACTVSHLAMRKEVNDSLPTAARSCCLVGRGKCRRARLTGGVRVRRRNSPE